MAGLLTEVGVTMRWFKLDINPEPWAVGPVGYSRRGGKMSAYVGRNQQLDAYKEAVREVLGEQTLAVGLHTLHLFFWRNRAEYTTPQARTHRKHEADLTNLQKATEDALQGVLFGNDRDVREVHSYLVEQGPEVTPQIIIGIESWTEPAIPSDALALVSDDPQLPFDDDSATWSPPEEVF